MKNGKGFIDSSGDPAVLDLLNEGRRRGMERSLPKGERVKVKKAQERQKARTGNRAVYDLPSDLIEAIAELAEKNSVPASQVAMIALRYFLHSGVDLDQFKQIPEKKSFRYDFRLVWFESTSYEGEKK